MAKWMEQSIGATAVPIEITLNDGLGGVAGDQPSVRIRRLTDGFYLDFNDQTFKSGGHTTIQLTAVTSGDETVVFRDFGGGRYRHKWDSSEAVTAPTTVAVEFTNVAGLAPGVNDDHITFTNSATILERLSKTPSASVGDGPGNCRFVYTLTKTSSAQPLPDATVYVTTDVGGNTIVAGPKLTDSAGKVIFYLRASTQYYFWRSKGGYEFTNPDLQSF